MILSCYKAKVQFTLEVEIKKKDADVGEAVEEVLEGDDTNNKLE